jgi:hypothetical protein
MKNMRIFHVPSIFINTYLIAGLMIPPELGRNQLPCVTINLFLLFSTDFSVSILHTQSDGLY